MAGLEERGERQAGGAFAEAAFEDGGVEVVPDVEAGLAVEGKRAVIFGGDGKADGGVPCAAQGVHAVNEQIAAEAPAAEVRRDAELGDVRDVVGDAGAEQQADEGAGAAAFKNPRVAWLKDTAAREADDVVEEAQRAVQRAVLVVDLGVDVALVREVDEVGGGLVVLGQPATKDDVAVGRLRYAQCGVCVQLALHEVAREAAEALVREERGEGAGGVEQELRLDALDAGAGEDEGGEVAQEELQDGVATLVAGRAGEGGRREAIADDGLLRLVDAEGKALDDALVESDEAREGAAVEIVEQELYRAAVVPAKAIKPEPALGFEDRSHEAGGGVAQIENLCHCVNLLSGSGLCEVAAGSE